MGRFSAKSTTIQYPTVSKSSPGRSRIKIASASVMYSRIVPRAENTVEKIGSYHVSVYRHPVQTMRTTVCATAARKVEQVTTWRVTYCAAWFGAVQGNTGRRRAPY